MPKIKTLKPLVSTIAPRLTPTSATETERIRGRKGQQIRHRRLLRTNYLCEMCQAKGVIRLADEVDHIVPLSQGGKDVDENTRNLCREHHLEVTAQQMGYRRRVTIGTDGWPIE